MTLKYVATDLLFSQYFRYFVPTVRDRKNMTFKYVATNLLFSFPVIL